MNQPEPITSTLVVLDDPGQPQAPGVWASAFADAGWEGRVEVPMPAGWYDAPPIEGGNYDMTDSIFELIRSGLDVDPLKVATTVVGIGVAGWSGTLWALAGRAHGLVLVDGCGGPWLSVEQRSERGVTHLRSQRDGTPPQPRDASLKVPMPTDPRRLFPPLAHGMRDLALEAAAALVAAGVPTHIAEWRDPEANDANAEFAAQLGLAGPGRIVDRNDVGAVASSIIGWMATQELG